MPANLTPEFKNARKRFRNAATDEDRLAALDEMLATIPKHKGTDKMRADIKKRISTIKNSKQQAPSRSKGSSPDSLPREGAGQVVLLGPPNAGKSTLLHALTNAQPEIANYPYSTLLPIPGMMMYEDVAIQLVDLPPVSIDFAEPWVYNLARNCDLCLLVVDQAGQTMVTEQVAELISLLEQRHIRPVIEEPDEQDLSMRYLSCRIIATKADLSNRPIAITELAESFPTISVSDSDSRSLNTFRKLVFDSLHLVRVYTKVPGKPFDRDEPYALANGSTVIDAVRAVHRDFAKHLKYVRIWGSGKFDGLKAPADHVLEDKDIIEIHVS